jgi:CPA1 family monovalent cation:H+ antiporter
LILAVPGGLLLGIGCALIIRRVNRFVNNTLGGNLLQFVIAFLIWIAAEHLGVSAVLATIAFAMTIARSAEVTNGTRMRVQSFAVWSAVVFALNVFAFLLMGLQGRAIITRMPAAHLKESLVLAGIVVVAIVVLRLAIVIGFNRLNAWWEVSHQRPEPVPWRQAVLEGWSGMRGFVSLATAVALPVSFPQRDLVVLIAFCVILATLVLQGATLTPLIRLLKLDEGDALSREIANGRRRLADAALTALAGEEGAEADNLRYNYLAQREAANDFAGACRAQRRRELGIAAILAQRQELERLRSNDRVGSDTYLLLQEELDWNELTLLCDDERRIEES